MTIFDTPPSKFLMVDTSPLRGALGAAQSRPEIEALTLAAMAVTAPTCQAIRHWFQNRDGSMPESGGIPEIGNEHS